MSDRVVELLVPAQDGVGGQDSCSLGKQTTAEDLAFGCEATALVVGESEALLAELLLQDSVLFDSLVDDLGLMAVSPACEGGEKELKREEIGLNARNVQVGRKGVS